MPDVLECGGGCRVQRCPAGVARAGRRVCSAIAPERPTERDPGGTGLTGWVVRGSIDVEGSERIKASDPAQAPASGRRLCSSARSAVDPRHDRPRPMGALAAGEHRGRSAPTPARRRVRVSTAIAGRTSRSLLLTSGAAELPPGKSHRVVFSEPPDLAVPPLGHLAEGERDGLGDRVRMAGLPGERQSADERVVDVDLGSGLVWHLRTYRLCLCWNVL